MTNELLKFISEMPNFAAYWMGKRDGYEDQIKKLLRQTPVADLSNAEAELKSLQWWFELTNDNFVKEMGWA